MKLLLDQNLPRRLLSDLEPLFPGSSHVRVLAMERASDAEIFLHARGEGFCVVTKDVDFRDLVAVRGFPPKVVLVRCGNIDNEVLRHRLLSSAGSIAAFLQSDDAGVFELL